MCASKREESRTAGGKEERLEKRYYMHEGLKTFAYLDHLDTSLHLLARVQHYDTS